MCFYFDSLLTWKEKKYTDSAASRLSPPDATRKLQVFGGNGHPFPVEANKVSVLKQAHQIHFCSLMQSSQSICLESQVLQIIGDFTNKSGKQQLRDQVVSPLLVVPDLI